MITSIKCELAMFLFCNSLCGSCCVSLIHLVLLNSVSIVRLNSWIVYMGEGEV